MRRVAILGLAFVGVLSLGAVPAAADHFLLAGASISHEVPLVATGGLSVEAVGALGHTGASCAGRAALSVRPPAQVLELLSVKSRAGRPPIRCVDRDSVCLAPVELRAINLPWYLDLDLRIIAPRSILVFLPVPGKTPGYSLRCLTILGLIEDRCEGRTVAVLANGAAGVSMTVAASVGSESPECSLTPGVEDAQIESRSLIGGGAAGLLSISE